MTRTELTMEYLREVEKSRRNTWETMKALQAEDAAAGQAVEEARLVYLKAQLDRRLCELDLEAQNKVAATRSNP